MIKTIEWKDGKVVMIDQLLLPGEEVYRTYTTHEEVAVAIETMVIRGAPAIGVAAAMGIALGMQTASTEQEFNEHLQPPVSNAADRGQSFLGDRSNEEALCGTEKPAGGRDRRELALEAQKILVEDIEANRRMGAFGSELVPAEARILTHCNAGALATAGYGTALGVIRAAVERGKKVEVFADETRPYLQGARLTAWELHKDQIPVTLITDSMAGYFMHQQKVDLVIVGADRIASNGDVANKIGTYSVAVLAKANQVPFYVAAPLSTIDMTLTSGEQIPIEERSVKEVVEIAGKRLAPDGISVRHPAFDVTPNDLIAAIITEKGIARAPYTESLRKLFGN